MKNSYVNFKKGQIGEFFTGLLVTLLDSILKEKCIQWRGRPEIEIRLDLNQEGEIFVHADPSEFSRSISNLVNNSVEAISGAGKVVVSIRSYKESVGVVISDNGKGMAEDVLNRIGEQGFTRGKDGTSSGSGLGVYYSRRFVESIGGKLLVQSKVGQGTMITLLLPKSAPFETIESRPRN